MLRERIEDAQREALAEAVTTRAEGLALDFARALHLEWRSARRIADDFARRDDRSIRSSLTFLVGDGDRVSWAGIARVDGTVTHASGGLLEGQDVSSRPWFQSGLEGDFAGDVHEAALLAKMLPTIEGEPRSFLNLATPLRRNDGSVHGVLGLHIDHAWARRHLTESARALELDAFLVDREGRISLSTDRSIAGETDLASIRAAASGASRTGVERWPDGKTYLTTIIPSVVYDDLPSFGWSLVARIESDAISVGEKSLSNTVLVALSAFGLLLAVITAAFVQIFIVPISRLAASADDQIAGRDTYPYESQGTAEARIISVAVARLASQSSAPGSPATRE
ncbi:MAG: cache domain-containing protein [Rhizobiaceae bacterium]|nr:cache domain-containing protein [Rhizobiaceae bacterium]MCV0405289.1 cache domain-containing protein [Rhizobiaceae bacterium]